MVELTPSEDIFIVVEQCVLYQLSSFSQALFYWFVVHCVFNLQYHKYAHGVGTFLQKFVFRLPSTEKRSPKHMLTVTDIQSLTMRLAFFPKFSL